MLLYHMNIFNCIPHQEWIKEEEMAITEIVTGM